MEESVAKIAAALLEGKDPRPAMTECADLAEQLDQAGKRKLLVSLNEVLSTRPIERLGPLPLLAGAIVEMGGDPRDFPPAIFDGLAELLGTIPTSGKIDEHQLPEVFYLFERAAMAALSRSRALRQGFPQRALIVSRIRRYSERYGFLGKMLSVLDDEPLVVLHPSSRRGWRFQMSGIADNFQLHALLLEALAGNGPDQIPGTRGAGHVSSDWQLASWPGLQPDLTISKDPDKGSWIWNEGLPAEIEVFEGQRIVLIGAAPYPRSWNAGRVFSALEGKLEPRGPMPGDEVSGLLDTLLARKRS